jgi:prepilin-type N-terminal cleavage/methylation domain-containing protein
MRLGVKGNSEKGVTMIELAIVLAIIGIMGLFMSPSLGEWVAGFRVRGAAKDLEDTLQQARLKAISTGNQYRVQLNINNGTGTETFVLQENDPDSGWTDDSASVTLPKGVNIDNIDGAVGGSINRTFRANGTVYGWAGGSATSSIFIENQRGDQYRIIVSQTGIIKMNEGW